MNIICLIVTGDLITGARKFKVIPQKLKLPMNFFETFSESSLLSTVSKKKNNKNDRSPFSLKRYDGPVLPYLFGLRCIQDVACSADATYLCLY